MQQETILALTHNVALLLGMALLFDLLVSRREQLWVPLRQVLAGLGVGAGALMLMLTPWVMSQGVVFDTRSVLLCNCGLFLGPVPTLIAMCIAAFFRWTQGGPAANVGMMVVFASGTIGLIWRYLRTRPLDEMRWGELYLLGLLVHEVMLLLMHTLPDSLSRQVLSQITFPVLLIYPLGTAALGMLLSNRLRRQRISAALRESEEQVRSTLYGIGDGVIATDHGARITRMNGVAERLTGWAEAEAKGRPLAEVFHIVNEDTRAPAPNPVERALREGVIVGLANHTVLIARDGCERPVADSASPLRDEDGGVSGVVMVFRDQTDERAAQKALRESEARFRKLVESAPEAIFVQTESRFAYANTAAVKLFGTAGGEGLVGRPVGDFFGGGELAALPESQTGEVAPVERRVLRCDGSARDVEVRAVRFVFHEKPGELVFVRDVTERKQAEARVIQAKEVADQANRAKDEFLARLSHELRTPLTPVLLASSQWRQRAEVPAALQKDLVMMHRNLELEARLLDDLLDLNCILQGKLSLRQEIIDLHDEVQNALAIVAAEAERKGVSLTLELGASPSLLSGDPARIQQVIWNLLNNSIKFTPPGGKVSVFTRNVAGQSLEVEVADTGVGIDPQVLPRLFQPFEQGGGQTTVRYGGMGLGLAICRSLVEMHGGTIAAQSDGAGRGTRVAISLPAAAASAARARVPASKVAGAGQRTGGQQRVLLVEDHADTARLLGRILQSWGYATRVATTLAEAREMAEREPVDLLISDLGLPDGSGHELMRSLSGKRGLRGIAISGYGMEDDQRKSREVGFAAHLTKPVSMAELRSTIERVLREAVSSV